METNGRGSIIVEDHPPHLAQDELALEANAEQRKSFPSFAGIDAAELSNYVDSEVDWLVDGIFSADQPTIFGAASKATKTTQLVDLSVALATATPWINSFDVSKRRRVLFITGESNRRAISKRIKRALKVRKLNWSDVQDWLRVEAIEFPAIPSATDQVGIKNDIDEHGIEVVIIDPLYRGLKGLDTHRMAEVGDAIISFVAACKPASVIISHHTIKSAAREFGTPMLEDLSGAGLAESCGNWWLIGRNKKYEFDRVHDLTVSFGGRDEQAGLKRIVFNEKDWTFAVTSGQDIKKQKERERAERDQKNRETQRNEAIAEIKRVIDGVTEAKPKSWFEDRCQCAKTHVRIGIAAMLGDSTLVEQDYKDSMNRRQTGFISCKHATPKPTATADQSTDG